MKVEAEFEKLHIPGLKGLFKIYGTFTILKRIAFYISFSSSIIFCFIVLYHFKYDKNILYLIVNILETGFTIISSLLGLSLAGLVLIVSFGNFSLLKSLIESNINKSLKNKKDISFSSYQTLISKFTYAVFIQVLSLFIFVIIFLIVDLKITAPSLLITFYLNVFVYGLIIFLLIYSIVLLGHMVVNIFTIAQMNHMVIFKEVIDEIIERDKKKDDNSV